MISLVEAQVFKYKSIEDSSPVTIGEDVTVLVGKNESGKSAFLEALHKALPATETDRVKFNFVFDYPRKDYVKYRPKHEAECFADVVKLTYCIDRELADRINKEVFDGSPVIQEDHMFARMAHYGNASIIQFEIDDRAALEALRKPLKAIEGIDEVWDGSVGLSGVLDRIDELQLPPDSSLSVFSKLWRAREPKELQNWGIVDYYLWNNYISTTIPHFLYFDDYHLLEGKVNLDALAQRKKQPQQLTDSDETVLGLFELAGTTIDELGSEQGYENSKAKLEAIGLTISQEVFEYWKQNQELSVEFDLKADPQDQPPFNAGKNLYIRIKNSRHGVTVPFDQRSKGFIWFFSFMVWFSSVQHRVATEKAVILLLDEPGLNLHALAQSDFLSYIDTLSKSHQIIYTTHSPFMVRSDRLDAVRVVEDKPKEGTKVTSDLSSSSDESVFPLQAALGYTIAQNLFIAKKNILIEGPADLLLLQHMSAVLEEDNRKGLEAGVFVPVGGLDKLATFIALLGANKLDIVVLHDRGSGPHQRLQELIQQKLIARKKVLDFSMFRTPDNIETDIEDLFPEALYVDALNIAYLNELNGSVLSVADLPKHPRVVERINQWLKAKSITLLKDGGFNHYRVARALLPGLTVSALSKPELQVFEILFARVNEALG
jgi:energy-coupling factor transporter ATP-binding protein EcfA2